MTQSATFDQAEILEKLSTDGYIALQADPEDEKALFEVAKIGNIQRHVRSKPDGVAEIGASAVRREASEAKYHFGLSQSLVPPHTDGCFISGFIQDAAGGIRPLRPPKALVLQEVDTATCGGGQFFVVLIRKLLNQLIEEYPRLFRALTSPEACFVRGRDTVCGARILTPENHGVFRWRYRADAGKMLLPSGLEEAAEFVRNYVNDPKNWVVFDSEPGQIIVIHNNAVLHGQLPYRDEKKLSRRLWLADAGDYLLPMGGLPQLHPELETLSTRYAPVSFEPKPIDWVPSGIKLDPKTARKAQSLLMPELTVA